MTDGMAGETGGRCRRFAMSAIRWYQTATIGRPSPCRFTPSCSAYALEAFDVHGAARGAMLTLRRLLRCRPFGRTGYDPVPERHRAHDRCEKHAHASSDHHDRDNSDLTRTAQHV